MIDATDPDRQRCAAIVRKALAAVRPQFCLAWRHGTHGVPHWSRVWFHGRRLALVMGLDPAVLAWFAYLHDSRRFDEHRDPEHGARAADFALQLHRERVITELARPDLERLCEAMRLHSDGHTEGDPVLQACWDADRLDLTRVGIEPDPGLLCTAYARHPSTRESACRMASAGADLARRSSTPMRRGEAPRELRPLDWDGSGPAAR